MLEALVKLLSSGLTLAPEVINLIAAIRAQPGMTDADILSHARTTNDAAITAAVAEKLRLMDKIAAEGGANEPA